MSLRSSPTLLYFHHRLGKSWEHFRLTKVSVYGSLSARIMNGFVLLGVSY